MGARDFVGAAETFDKRTSVIAGAVVSVFFPFAVQAAQVNPIIGFSAAESYLERVEGKQTEDHFFFEVSPMAGLALEGKNSSFEGTYAFSKRVEQSSGDQYDSQALNVNGSTQFFKKSLKVDAGGSITEQTEDPFGNISLNPIVDSENRAEVWSAYSDVTLRQRLGSTLRGEATYSFNKTYSPDSKLLNGSEMETVNASLFPRRVLNIGWNLLYNLKETRFSGKDTAREESLSFMAEYAANRFRPFTQVGFENNSNVVMQEDMREGDYWTVGFNWRVGQRIETKLMYGEHDYGQAAMAQILWKTRKSQLSLSHNESLVTRTAIQTDVPEKVSLDAENPEQSIVFAPTLDRVIDGYFLRKYTQLKFSAKSKKVTLGAYLYRDENTEINNVFDQTTVGGQLSLETQLGRSLSATAFVARDDYKSETAGLNDVLDTGSLAMTFKGSKYIVYKFENSVLRRGGQSSAGSYRELYSRLSVSISLD